MDHRLLIAMSMNVLPRAAENFDHNPSLEKFLDFVGENRQQQP